MAENATEKNEAGHDEGYTAGELQYLLQAYQEQYSVLTRELKESSDAVMGISSAIEALDNKKSVTSKESLVPAGAGLYFYAKTSDSESVVVSIGGGLMIDTDAAAAKEIMNRRFNAQRDNMNRISRQMKQIEDTIYDISYKIEGLTAD
ncbi:MAG: prefoldin subunit alpha [Candidatus Micrarchaeaceae archaeon]